MFIAPAAAEQALENVTEDDNCSDKERKSTELMRKDQSSPITGLERSKKHP